ncbi:hypothetical protein BDR06DRAFT_972627 [Suillus hirtellus]|nr:hypothetical protein BDR06DRAFT_972627 [Suillus hirtellus]
MQQSVTLKGCNSNVQSSCTDLDGQGTHQYPNNDLQEHLAVVEKNCNHFLELYRKYRLRCLEEIHCANIPEKYAPDMDCYTAAQIPWDAPSPFSGEILDNIDDSHDTDDGDVTPQGSSNDVSKTGGKEA